MMRSRASTASGARSSGSSMVPPSVRKLGAYGVSMTGPPGRRETDDSRGRDRLVSEVAVEVLLALLDHGHERVANQVQAFVRTGVVEVATPVGGSVVVERARVPGPHLCLPYPDRRIGTRVPMHRSTDVPPDSRARRGRTRACMVLHTAADHDGWIH